MKVLFIISGLNPGGAEMMLYRLLETLGPGIKPHVISLTSIGQIGEQIEKLGIPVEACSINKSIGSTLKLFRLARRIRAIKPDLVHTWMYHANLLGGLAVRLAGNTPLIWGIHHNNLDPKLNCWSTRLIARLGAMASPILPRHIVCCSRSALYMHAKIGYTREKLSFIPNGINTKQFSSAPQAAQQIRRTFGLENGSKLIGMIGRFDPLKNHEGFFKYAEQLSAATKNVHFLLAGANVDSNNQFITSLVEKHHLRQHMHLLGIRSDIPALMSAIDLLVLPSLSEAFPNVLLEAMACNTPCISFDVGDAADIIGDSGVVIAKYDIEQMTAATLAILADNEKRYELGVAARHRIETLYSIENVTRQYINLYNMLLKHPHK